MPSQAGGLAIDTEEGNVPVEAPHNPGNAGSQTEARNRKQVLPTPSGGALP